MILPQRKEGRHGVEVVGMFLFDDNLDPLRAGDPVGKRLAGIAAEHGMRLMACDPCAPRRGFAEGMLEGCGRGV